MKPVSSAPPETGEKVQEMFLSITLPIGKVPFGSIVVKSVRVPPFSSFLINKRGVPFNNSYPCKYRLVPGLHGAVSMNHDNT